VEEYVTSQLIIGVLLVMIPSSALTLLVGQQEGHAVCRKIYVNYLLNAFF